MTDTSFQRIILRTVIDGQIPPKILGSLPEGHD